MVMLSEIRPLSLTHFSIFSNDKEKDKIGIQETEQYSKGFSKRAFHLHSLLEQITFVAYLRVPLYVQV